MFQEEDIIIVRRPYSPLYHGGEIVQVDENDYEIGLRILKPTNQKVGHVDLLARALVENLFLTGVLAIDETNAH